MSVDDPERHLGVAYEIRDRRLPELSGQAVPALQLVFVDDAGRWPWEPGTADPGPPLLGPQPSVDGGRDVTL